MTENYLNKNNYFLSWSETFDNSSLDDSVWNIREQSYVADNNELQSYVNSRENLSIKDNKLHISPTRTSTDQGFDYHSALVTTEGKKEFSYGIFEIRMKIPLGRGYIPFFKLCSSEKYGEWPTGGQVDIVMIPTRRPDTHYSTIHYKCNDKNVMEQGAYEFDEGNYASDEFHTYACEWLPGKMNFFVDGKLFFESTVDKPFDHPMYLYLGMAIGGNLALPPDMTTVFSDENAFIVDYINVYQKFEYDLPQNLDTREVVAVCGSWEDAENFNIFLRALQTPEFTSRYVTAVFSFGALEHDDSRINELDMVSCVERINPSAIFVFSEMIHNKEIVEGIIDVSSAKDIPLVMLENRSDKAINVVCDYDGAFEEIVRHMIEHHGYKDINMFAGSVGNEFSENRIKIFKKVMSEHGLPCSDDKIFHGEFWDEAAAATLERLFAEGFKVPEAFVCANDSMALGITNTLKKHGYKVPDDVKIIGFDGIRETELHYPAISTCSLDYGMISQKLLEVLDLWKSSDNHEELLKKEIKVGFKMIYRESCGCTRSESYEEIMELVSQVAHDNTDSFRHMYEMSRFVSKAVQSDDFFESVAVLERHLWLWLDQFYFIGMQGKDKKLRVLFSGYKNEYKYNNRYINYDKAFPDIDRLLRRDSGINFIMLKQIRVHSEDFVFVVSGLKNITLRSQQRFDELALFLSTVLDSVYNNKNYLSANEEISRISERDYLTGLYNRRGFTKELDRMIKNYRFGKPVVTLFSVDMDGLKTINDTFGHACGDKAIQIMANTLLQYAGSKGVCVRFGGDEFAFAILSEVEGAFDIKKVRMAIEEIIDNDPEAYKMPFQVRASIGFAEQVADGSVNIEDMLLKADDMMYQDKKVRKSRTY